MPRGDGTGPKSFGARTGRAAGFCAGFGVPGFENSIPGRGYGDRGRGGGGMRHRHRYYATGNPALQAMGFENPVFQMTKESQLGALKQQSDYFEKVIENLKKRIHEIQRSGEEQSEKR